MFTTVIIIFASVATSLVGQRLSEYAHIRAWKGTSPLNAVAAIILYLLGIALMFAGIFGVLATFAAPMFISR